MRRDTRSLVLGFAAVALIAGACGASGDRGGENPAGAIDEVRGDEVRGEVVVFAASSLTEAFGDLAEAFTAQHPDTEVTLSFSGSADLVTQIGEGAPADVFASADDATMARLTDEGLAAGEPTVVARNTFEIIVEHGNPLGITGLADLTDPDLIVVLCAETVPCGAGANTVLANARVTLTPKSLEDRVKGVVTKVVVGEADAGIVYATDVRAAGGTASGVAIPAEVNVTTDYPIIVTRDAPNPVVAQAFVDFVAGASGQSILAGHGFLAP